MKAPLRFLMTALPLFALPVSCLAAGGEADSVCFFSYVYSGMQAPQSIYVWQAGGRAMMQTSLRGREYRREVPLLVLEQFSALAGQHRIADWAGHRDSPLPAGMQILDGSSYSLDVVWDSGRRLSLSGRSLPEGSSAFMGELRKLWDETVQRYPYVPPRESRSDSMHEFTFAEYTGPEETDRLALHAEDAFSHTAVRVPRGQPDGGRAYSKAPLSFLKKLHALIRKYRPYLWHSPDAAAAAEQPAEGAFPYAKLRVAYYRAPEEHVRFQVPAPQTSSKAGYGEKPAYISVPDCDERVEAVFFPAERPEYEQWKKDVLTLFQEAEQKEKRSPQARPVSP